MRTASLDLLCCPGLGGLGGTDDSVRAGPAAASPRHPREQRPADALQRIRLSRVEQHLQGPPAASPGQGPRRQALQSGEDAQHAAAVAGRGAPSFPRSLPYDTSGFPEGIARPSMHGAWDCPARRQESLFSPYVEKFSALNATARLEGDASSEAETISWLGGLQEGKTFVRCWKARCRLPRLALPVLRAQQDCRFQGESFRGFSQQAAESEAGGQHRLVSGHGGHSPLWHQTSLIAQAIPGPNGRSVESSARWLPVPVAQVYQRHGKHEQLMSCGPPLSAFMTFLLSKSFVPHESLDALQARISFYASIVADKPFADAVQTLVAEVQQPMHNLSRAPQGSAQVPAVDPEVWLRETILEPPGHA